MTDEATGQNDPLKALGRYIKEQRTQAELTLRELAERANVSNPYLSQIERGLHEPSVRVLKAIAGALEVSGETLLRQAGLIDPDTDADSRPAVTVETAVKNDPDLDSAGKETLLQVYRSLRKQA
ncbi:MAG TPA: helix-turn-helix transcriptional regulator [Acidimicrobiales bacterium]|nr:helix-turn-helix transcriptional regulator [Acidimicrobiales bacterium]